MKSTGLLFKGPMVRAILDGRKTQTRRIVKPQPPSAATHAGVFLGGNHDGQWSWMDGDPRDFETWGMVDAPDFRCPYGVPGDEIWVRETWRAREKYDRKPNAGPNPGSKICYEADAPFEEGLDVGRKRSALFLPRWATRIVRTLTDVRIERVQGISAEDALAEGVDGVTIEGRAYTIGAKSDLILGYQQLWDSINLARGFGWDSNPFVYVLEWRNP